MKSLIAMFASFALFVGCGESYVSLDGGELDKATGGCEHCEDCESDSVLADKDDDSKESTKEVDTKDTGEEQNTEEASATDNSEDPSQEERSKDDGEENKPAN